MTLPELRMISPRISSLGRRLALSLGAGSILVAILVLMCDAANLPIFVTSWLSSSALLLSDRWSSISHPANILFSHVVCGVIGLVWSRLMPGSEWALIPAFGLALTAMLQTKLLHPPAAANVAIAIFMPTSPQGLLLAFATGGCSLAGVAWAMRRWDGMTGASEFSPGDADPCTNQASIRPAVNDDFCKEAR